jgi:hypothetical protein
MTSTLILRKLRFKWAREKIPLREAKIGLRKEPLNAKLKGRRKRRKPSCSRKKSNCSNRALQMTSSPQGRAPPDH